MGKREKPRCKLAGTDGNIFALVGKASETLRKVGLQDKAKEMQSKAFKSHSYEDALDIICSYVDAY